MLRTLVAMLLGLVSWAGTAAEAAAPSEAPKPPAAELQGTGRDFDNPPPGSAKDQSLWREAYAANNDVLLVRGAAARLQQRATAGQYQQRLETLEKGPAEVAGRAAKLEGRLRAEWTRSFEIAARPWPVDPTRACRYPMMNFDSAMLLAEGSEKNAHLAGSRRDLRDCLDKAQLAIGAMAKSNQDFEAVIGEVERFLSAAPAPAASAAPPPPGKSQ